MTFFLTVGAYIGGGLIAAFAFYQLLFGGSDKPQDSFPPTIMGGENGGMGS